MSFKCVAWLKTPTSSLGVMLGLRLVLCVVSSMLCSAAIAQAVFCVPQPLPLFPVAVSGGAGFSLCCPAPFWSCCCSHGACEDRGVCADGKICGSLRMTLVGDDTSSSAAECLSHVLLAFSSRDMPCRLAFLMLLPSSLLHKIAPTGHWSLSKSGLTLNSMFWLCSCWPKL